MRFVFALIFAFLPLPVWADGSACGIPPTFDDKTTAAAIADIAEQDVGAASDADDLVKGASQRIRNIAARFEIGDRQAAQLYTYQLCVNFEAAGISGNRLAGLIIRLDRVVKGFAPGRQKAVREAPGAAEKAEAPSDRDNSGVVKGASGQTGSGAETAQQKAAEAAAAAKAEAAREAERQHKVEEEAAAREEVVRREAEERERAEAERRAREAAERREREEAERRAREEAERQRQAALEAERAKAAREAEERRRAEEQRLAREKAEQAAREAAAREAAVREEEARKKAAKAPAEQAEQQASAPESGAEAESLQEEEAGEEAATSSAPSSERTARSDMRRRSVGQPGTPESGDEPPAAGFAERSGPSAAFAPAGDAGEAASESEAVEEPERPRAAAPASRVGKGVSGKGDKGPAPGRSAASVEECPESGVLVSDCLDVDATLAKLRDRPVEYNHPKEMVKGEQTEITLVLRTDFQGEGLPKEVSEAFEGLEGKVKQQRAKVSRIMSARLRGRNFEVDPKGLQERTLTWKTPTTWSWYVTPRKSGQQQTLKLELFAHIIDARGQKQPPVLIKTLDATIDVDVRTVDWLIEQARAFEPIYGIVAALLGLLTALVTFWYRRRSARQTAGSAQMSTYAGAIDREERKTLSDMSASEAAAEAAERGSRDTDGSERS